MTGRHGCGESQLPVPIRAVTRPFNDLGHVTHRRATAAPGRSLRAVLWRRRPYGYPDSLAPCIVDSVQSTGVKYPSVEKVVKRYRAYRRDQDGDPHTVGTAELLQTFEENDGPAGWSKKIGKLVRTIVGTASDNHEPIWPDV